MHLDKTLFYVLQLYDAYKTREKAIKGCVTQVSSTIQKLQERREGHGDNPDILRHLRNEQTKVLIQYACIVFMKTSGITQ